jgi:hypothetical protein
MVTTRLLPALNRVKEKLLAEDIEHTDQVLRVIRENAVPLVNALSDSYTNVRGSTCFLISCIGVTEDRFRLRLGLIHPDWDYDLAFYQPNSAAFVGPADLGTEEVRRYAELMRTDLSVPDDGESDDDEFVASLSESISENVKLVARCFSEISGLSRLVSPDLDVAIMLITGGVLYGYGDSRAVSSKGLKMAVIPPGFTRCILTPKIVGDGKP